MSRRVQVEWQNRVVAEYRSSALTAEVLHGILACGLDESLARTATRIVNDELDHARLSMECLEGLGFVVEPPAIELSSLSSPPHPAGPLASLTSRIVKNFCLGETFAVPLFVAMREHTSVLVARQALDRIVRDEAVHRAFGWDTFKNLMELDAGVAAFTAQHLSHWIEDYRQSYGVFRESLPLDEEEKSCGLLDIADYVRIFDQTLSEEILPRFARHGIV